MSVDKEFSIGGFRGCPVTAQIIGCLFQHTDSQTFSAVGGVGSAGGAEKWALRASPDFAFKNAASCSRDICDREFCVGWARETLRKHQN